MPIHPQPGDEIGCNYRLTVATYAGGDTRRLHSIGQREAGGGSFECASLSFSTTVFSVRMHKVAETALYEGCFLLIAVLLRMNAFYDTYSTCGFAENG